MELLVSTQQQEEWLAELAFVHFYKAMHEKSGLDFGRRWNALTQWERDSWCETAKTIQEVTAQLDVGALLRQQRARSILRDSAR